MNTFDVVNGSAVNEGHNPDVLSFTVLKDLSCQENLAQVKQLILHVSEAAFLIAGVYMPMPYACRELPIRFTRMMYNLNKQCVLHSGASSLGKERLGLYSKAKVKRSAGEPFLPLYANDYVLLLPASLGAFFAIISAHLVPKN